MKRHIKTSLAERAMARLLFPFIMGLLWPLRLLGFFGTKSKPIYFDAGAPIPFWLELYAPRRHCHFDFVPQSKVWFDYRTGYMVVQALEPATTNALFGPRDDGVTIKSARIWGAPTEWRRFDGERAPEPKSELALQR